MHSNTYMYMGMQDDDHKLKLVETGNNISLWLEAQYNRG